MDVAKTKKPATPKSVAELVTHALLTAATKPTAKWAAASAAGLFNTKEELHGAAQAECTKRGAELLKPAGSGGVLTAAGFARIADALPKADIGAIALRSSDGLTAAERFEFLSAAISRFPDTAAELTPALDAAATAKEAERAAEVEAAAKRAAAREANLKALDRAREILLRDRENEVAAVRKLWEALGQSATDLPALPEVKPAGTAPTPDPVVPRPGPEPRTQDDRDFRQHTVRRLIESWLHNLKNQKAEAATALERILRGTTGVQAIGVLGTTVSFDGRLQDCGRPVPEGAQVRVTRIGWAFKDDPGEPLCRAVVE
jgi:hypothetical protein